ncbi:hypothetical protein HOLleu_05888 [Holothuria leucospilota]|uniref:Uncharacterized protein n=1 Tax=Holothuria leucospilota TaxID=206669 RepID=A0A9Q1CLR6_HOLLE|nr:hypothetical protein HOLleu_05888 [Holothuria leucospilota]
MSTCHLCHFEVHQSITTCHHLPTCYSKVKFAQRYLLEFQTPTSKRIELLNNFKIVKLIRKIVLMINQR